MTTPTGSPESRPGAAEILREGAAILAPVLEPRGFRFVLQAEGRGSGGRFAAGAFVRGDRRVELHYRHALGLVTYHVGTHALEHRAYMAALGATEQAAYPGFSADPLAGFRHLAHDLAAHGADFLTGDCEVLQAAAAVAAAASARRQTRQLAGHTGDTKKRSAARSEFRAGRYAQVLALLASLAHPELLTESEQRMLALARERVQP